ncbi:hypothetical protein GCM10009795_039990 [Nocardioides hankookensis]|uniref:HK97 gp10 family phage protein n=1 Tax=Nocardioides hankookensis TaxID=443157 RepID=A0ABW1LP76_9ACTN
MVDVDVEIQGADELARALRTLARDLRPEVMAAIENASKHADDLFAAGARTTLPSQGGLADKVADVRWAIKASHDEIRIHPDDSPYDLTRINEGRLLHPVWGDRDVWVEQEIRPGWAEEPTERQERAIADAVDEAAEHLAKNIERTT